MMPPTLSPARRAAGLLHARPLALRRDMISSSFVVLEGRLAMQDDQPGLLGRIARHVGVGAKRKPRASALRAEISGEGRSFGTVMGGVAIITIDGPLLDRAIVYTSWWDDEPYICIDGYDRIWGAFVEAMSAPDVKAVVLRISSPGGMVSGCFDLCAKIAEAADADGAKPVIAYLDDHAYSAGYAIACSGLAILAPQLGGCGSIGVLAVHESFAGFYESHGVVHTFIESHDLKSAGAPEKPLEPEAEAMIREHVLAASTVFTAHVAARRAMEATDIDAFRAGWFTAEAALENGLIDAIATFDETLAGLQADPAAFLDTIFAPDETTDPSDSADPGTALPPKETATMIKPTQTAKTPKAAAAAKGAKPKAASAATEGTEEEGVEEGAETDEENLEEGAEGDDTETGDDGEKKDESAKIAASPYAKTHAALALAAIQSGQTLKQFEASAKAMSGGKNQLASRMAGERRLGADGKPPVNGAAKPLDAAGIYASRRAVTRSASRAAAVRRDSRGTAA